jgi:hydrogenase maturation factor
MNINDILQLADKYEQNCILKSAKIRKLPNGKYRVLSQKNKNLGTYNSLKGAKERLKMVEIFKHIDQAKADDKVIDLTEAFEFSYSSVIRELRRQASKEQTIEFMKIFKKEFDKAVVDELQKPERIALQNSLIKFNKIFKIKLKKNFVKNAATSELGEASKVGKYLSDIVKFTISKISPENRQKSLNNLRNRFYTMNANELANKKMPNSASIGQSIIFVKSVLFNHEPNYIREVLNNLVKNL